MYPLETLPDLSTLKSAFRLQEYISLTIRYNIHHVSNIISIPSSRTNVEGGSDDNNLVTTDDDDGEEDTTSKFAVDEACWIYEQLRYVLSDASTKRPKTYRVTPRRLAQDLSHPLITMLQQECTRATCPEMKAGEWMYLCVAHGNNGEMEASLGIFHAPRCYISDRRCSNAAPSTSFCTLSTARRRSSIHHERSHHCTPRELLPIPSFSALLTLPRRNNIPPLSHRHFGSLARRLGRIFAHAFFHHREVFEQAEAESSLYARFLALTYKYDFGPPEFLIIPTQDLEASRLAALHREELNLVISVG